VTEQRQRLRAARREAGLTQQDLADRAGIHRVTVAVYEAGRKEPGVGHALAIAGVLGTCAEQLFGDEVER
jgi:DNA-binding XRE family transcriptional regulator